MKAIDIIIRSKNLLSNFTEYIFLRLDHMVGSKKPSSIELLGWCVLFVAISTKLFHLGGYTTPLVEYVKINDQRNGYYQIVSEGGELKTVSISKDDISLSRPSLKRVDIMIDRSKLYSSDARWWNRLFLDLGFKRLYGIDEDKKIQYKNDLIGFVSKDEKELSTIAKVTQSDSKFVERIEKDQEIIKSFFIDETYFRFGFVQLVFNYIPVSMLWSTESYILTLMLIVACCSTISFYLSARILNTPQPIRTVMDLCIRNIAIWFFIIGMTNFVLGLFGIIKLPQSKIFGVIYLFYVCLLFIFPSLNAWKNLYKQSWLKFACCSLVSIPLSIIPGILIFLPSVYIITKYQDVLFILGSLF